MATPDFTLRSLLEAGVHLGHQTHRWNPRMEKYIHSKRNGIHIIDLTQTVVLLRRSLKEIENVVAKNGNILFVGTKRQAQTPIEKAATDSAQHYVNHRWLGGTLTNWKTVSSSISRLDELDERINEGLEGLTKKERLGMLREQAKLENSHGGIRNMKRIPDLLFVIDVKKESLAIAEANKLNIPVIAVVDTNCAPDGIDFVIPGNDDATGSIKLFCELATKAIIEGLNTQMRNRGSEPKEKGVDEELSELEKTGKAEEALQETKSEEDAEPESSKETDEVKDTKNATATTKKAKSTTTAKETADSKSEEKKPAKATKSNAKSKDAEKPKATTKKATSLSKVKTTTKAKATAKPKVTTKAKPAADTEDEPKKKSEDKSK